MRNTSGSASWRLRDRVEVVVEVDVRVLAVDEVDLACRGSIRVLRDRLGDELVGRQRVGMRLLLRGRERAELALHPADVRLVEVEVLDEEDAVVAAAHAPRQVGQLADREQVVGLEQRQAVVEVEPLAGDHLLADERRARCRRGDRCS